LAQKQEYKTITSERSNC